VGDEGEGDRQEAEGGVRQVSGRDFLPRDIDIAVRSFFEGTFGKCEVEVAAYRLVCFLNDSGQGWRQFSLFDLCDWYRRRGLKEQPLFGLMGLWLDDGGNWCVRSAEYVINEGDCLSVTDEFLRRIAKFVKVQR